jgi:ATP-dependent helicase/nuclease subunit B
MRREFLATLERRVTLVTPSRRFAGLIADRYNADHLQAGSLTWEAPLVLPFSAWVSDSFQRLALDRQTEFSSHLLLSSEQERALWEQVIGASDDVDFDQIDNLAALAMKAWSTVLLWKIPLSQITAGTTREEVRAFERWARGFQQRCVELEAVDQSRFALRLSELGGAISTLLAPFEFFGYTRLPPTLAEIRALTLKRDSGSGGSCLETSTSPEYRAYPNSEMELNAAITWAAARKVASPQSDIVIALTGSNRVDANLAQRLQRVLTSSAEEIAGDNVLTLGFANNTSFADIPMIQLALLILDWQRSRPWDEISRLLLAPYLGEAELEHEERALLDCDLRRHGDVEISISWALEAARSASSCAAFVQRVEGVTTVFEGAPTRQRIHDWMLTVDAMLTAAGWPGGKALIESEQLALVEWHRVMDSLAQLDAVVPPCTWSELLSELRSALRGRRQPTSTPINAIQLVTLEEASFLQADALWIADLHDGAWPELPDANPLVPFNLQRECAVPGTDPERDLRDAEQLLESLSDRNAEVIWSFAQIDGETPRRPLAGFEIRPLSPDPVDYWPHSGASRQFKTYPDNYATELESDANIRGGVGVFTDQAACPMRAVAKHRLHTRTPADATPGLSPLQRGNLIHAVLALFWTEVKSSERLEQKSEQEIVQTTTRCVDCVVADFRRRYRFIDAYWELEAQRLVELTHEWLNEERKRGPFEVIACEQSRAAALGGFVINTRVDRVDRLSNGAMLIIDYKTGAVPRSGWELPRPDQPQLPIYAVTTRDDEIIGGVAFAGIKKGNCRFVDEPRGTGLAAPLSDDSSAQWLLQSEAWRRELGGLADEIRAGQALAKPKRGAATCRYCDLQVLCRIHEVRRARVDQEPTDD